jgi:hypothetical protein
MSEFEDRRKDLFDALRSGKYGKCESRLAGRGNTRCVMGVAIEVALEKGWITADEAKYDETTDTQDNWGGPVYQRMVTTEGTEITLEEYYANETFDTQPPQKVVDLFIDPNIPIETVASEYNPRGFLGGQDTVMSAMIEANDTPLPDDSDTAFRSFTDLADLFERWEKEGAFNSASKAHALYANEVRLPEQEWQ